MTNPPKPKKWCHFTKKEKKKNLPRKVHPHFTLVFDFKSSSFPSSSSCLLPEGVGCILFGTQSMLEEYLNTKYGLSRWNFNWKIICTGFRTYHGRCLEDILAPWLALLPKDECVELALHLPPMSVQLNFPQLLFVIECNQPQLWTFLKL